jgi:hypothetical protein
MQNPDTANLRAKIFFVFAKTFQRFSGRLEKDAVHLFGIMQTIVIQAFGNRENSVEILAVKHIREAGDNPFVTLSALTFGTVPIPATVIRNMNFTACIALFYMTAKRCRPAMFKRIQHPLVIIQNSVP